MAINFDALPDKGPSFVLPDGYYKGLIAEAPVMRKGKESGKEYLSVVWELTDANGKKRGKFFDRYMESDKPALMYKLQRLIVATKLPIEGNFELADLGKILKGRSAVLNIIVTKDQRGNETNDLKLFGSDILYPIEEFASLVYGKDAAAAQKDPETVINDDDLPIMADDADDADEDDVEELGADPLDENY